VLLAAQPQHERLNAQTRHDANDIWVMKRSNDLSKSTEHAVVSLSSNERQRTNRPCRPTYSKIARRKG